MRLSSLHTLAVVSAAMVVLPLAGAADAAPANPTEIVGFSVTPGTASVQSGIAVKGQAREQVSSQWRPYQGDVALYFQPSGSRSWRLVTTLTSNYQGGFSTNEPSLINGDDLAHASGQWQARIDPTAWVVGSSSPAQYVRVGLATRIWGFGADSHWSPHGQVRTVGGVLSECLGGSSPCMTWAALNHLKIKFYFRYRGSKTWHYAKSTTTTGRGADTDQADFGVNLPRTTRGTWWRAEFVGSGYIYGSTSPGVYVPGGR